MKLSPAVQGVNVSDYGAAPLSKVRQPLQTKFVLQESEHWNSGAGIIPSRDAPLSLSPLWSSKIVKYTLSFTNINVVNFEVKFAVVHHTVETRNKWDVVMCEFSCLLHTCWILSLISSIIFCRLPNSTASSQQSSLSLVELVAVALIMV